MADFNVALKKAIMANVSIRELNAILNLVLKKGVLTMTHDISYDKFTCGFSEENLMKNTTTENKLFVSLDLSSFGWINSKAPEMKERL